MYSLNSVFSVNFVYSVYMYVCFLYVYVLHCRVICNVFCVYIHCIRSYLLCNWYILTILCVVCVLYVLYILHVDPSIMYADDWEVR